MKKICEGYRKGVFEQYGDALKAFDEVEKVALREKGEGEKTDVKKEAMGLQGLDKQR